MVEGGDAQIVTSLEILPDTPYGGKAPVRFKTEVVEVQVVAKNCVRGGRRRSRKPRGAEAIKAKRSRPSSIRNIVKTPPVEVHDGIQNGIQNAFCIPCGRKTAAVDWLPDAS